MEIGRIDLSTYQYSYHQLVFMPEAFRSSGNTRGIEFSVEQVLNRTGRSKTAAVAKVIHKHAIVTLMI